MALEVADHGYVIENGEIVPPPRQRARARDDRVIDAYPAPA